MTTRSGSSFRLVLRSPLYRRATLSLYFAGLGISIAMPQLSLFLVQDLHASLPVAGLFFLTNLAAPVLGFLVGQLVGPADRPAPAVPGRCGGRPRRLGADGVHHPGVDGVRGQPHGPGLRRRDQLADLRGRPGPADPRPHRGRQPGHVDGPARLQSGLHDRADRGQRGRRDGRAPGHADRGRRLHPAAGGADDRPAGRASRARARSGTGRARPSEQSPAQAESGAAADLPRV